MTCEELHELIPEMVDGSLSVEVLTEALAILPSCPDCERELEIARQVHEFITNLEVNNPNIRIPIGFEARVLKQVREQTSGQDLLELLSQSLGDWLIEILNLLGSFTVSSTNNVSKRI